MPENDPGLELNCPKCDKKLQYEGSGSSGGGAYNLRRRTRNLT
jgi:hypothetical protein